MSRRTCPLRLAAFTLLGHALSVHLALGVDDTRTAAVRAVQAASEARRLADLLTAEAEAEDYAGRATA